MRNKLVEFLRNHDDIDPSELGLGNDFEDTSDNKE